MFCDVYLSLFQQNRYAGGLCTTGGTLQEVEDTFIDRLSHPCLLMTIKDVTVVIDESGNDGLNGENNEHIFVIGATITSEPEKLSAIAFDMKKSLSLDDDYELKYKRRTRIRRIMLNNITETGATLLAVYIDKNDLDTASFWFEHKNRRSIPHRRVLESLCDALMTMDIDDLTVIIDHHSALESDEGCNIVRRSAELNGKNITEVSMQNSATGECRNLLQTCDYNIGALGKILREKEAIPSQMTVIKL